MATFKAIRIDKDDQGYRAGAACFDEADLMDGDVTVRVTHSTINYKDGSPSPASRRWCAAFR
jgi:acrylyl-CoA reductase (NADPH)